MSSRPPQSPENRLDQIRRDIVRQGEVYIAELSRRYHVSEMTVRRDLDTLAAQGEVIRTRGGAVSAKRLTFEFTFRAEHNRHLKQKEWIGRVAVRFVEDGQVVILDTGTTTLEVARNLIGKRKIKVITVSLPVVSALQFDPEIEIILLGGHLRDQSPDLHGPLTEQNLAMFKSDVAFLGAGGIDADGSVYTDDLRVLNLDQKMVQISRRVIVAADSSKFRRAAMCKVMGPEDYQVLITDAGVDPKTVRKLTNRGIHVEVVGEPTGSAE